MHYGYQMKDNFKYSALLLFNVTSEAILEAVEAQMDQKEDITF